MAKAVIHAYIWVSLRRSVGAFTTRVVKTAIPVSFTGFNTYLRCLS